MENVDWRHLTTGSSGLTGQARSQLNRMLRGQAGFMTAKNNVLKPFQLKAQLFVELKSANRTGSRQTISLAEQLATSSGARGLSTNRLVLVAAKHMAHNI